MKSKKSNPTKLSWVPYPNPIPPKENSSVSQSIRETVSDIFLSVDPPAMNIPTNHVNSGASQVSPPSLSSPSPQPPATMQPAGFNVPTSQGQGMANSAKSNLNSSTIPYNNNQSADPDLWDGLFTLTSLLIKKYLSSDAQNITCSLLRIGTFIQQCSLGDRPAKNFPELVDISTVT